MVDELGCLIVGLTFSFVVLVVLILFLIVFALVLFSGVCGFTCLIFGLILWFWVRLCLLGTFDCVYYVLI